jgi:hypothetical protein
MIEKCNHCDIWRDKPCQMCKYRSWQGCLKGSRMGGLYRKCFECMDIEFCKKQDEKIRQCYD